MSGHFENRLKDLRELPELTPSADVEARTLAAMAAEAQPARPARNPLRLATAAALVAAAAAASLWAVRGSDQAMPPPDTRNVALFDEAYFELVEESARLDELLAVLPEPRRLMRADTASTIVGLEDQVALIDAALGWDDPAVQTADYREALLRDRVEVMNALVNVRYSQSRAFTF